MVQRGRFGCHHAGLHDGLFRIGADDAGSSSLRRALCQVSGGAFRPVDFEPGSRTEVMSDATLTDPTLAASDDVRAGEDGGRVGPLNLVGGEAEEVHEGAPYPFVIFGPK